LGWRPSAADLDRYGRTIPDDEYQTKDFERAVALKARTDAIARHLTDFLKKTDRFAKTIVFCVDQEHAREMREALGNLSSDLRVQHPDYVVRVTSDEGDIGKGHLSRFQDVETQTPVILTSSQLLTTGVDAPTCKNVVLARIVGTMSEFKQIVGRGTRLREDYGKLWFNIIDYTGSATRMFADPAFDGDLAQIIEDEVSDDGEIIATTETKLESDETETEPPEHGDPAVIEPPDRTVPRKFYYDGGQVEIALHLVYELDPNGKQLRVVKYTDYAADSVARSHPHRPIFAPAGPMPASAGRSSMLWPSAASTSGNLPSRWASPRRTRSTFSAISLSTRRCAPGASTRSVFARSARTSSRATAPKRARCSTNFWRSTPSTAMHSSFCPMSCA
jgi:type I restriction enzyme R subunit